MNIVRKSPDKYTILKDAEHHFSLVKILKGYDNDKSAIGDLTRLTVGEITERDLLGGDYEQDVAAGKLGNRINVLEAAMEGIRDSLTEAIGGSRLEEAAREAVKRISELIDEKG